MAPKPGPSLLRLSGASFLAVPLELRGSISRGRATALGFRSVLGSNFGKLALVGDSPLSSNCECFGVPDAVRCYGLNVHKSDGEWIGEKGDPSFCDGLRALE